MWMRLQIFKIYFYHLLLCFLSAFLYFFFLLAFLFLKIPLFSVTYLISVCLVAILKILK